MWTRNLTFLSEYATAILNVGDYGAPINVSIPIRDFGVEYEIGVFDVQDVFLQKDYYNFDMDDVFHIPVSPNSVVFLHLYPSEFRLFFKRH